MSDANDGHTTCTSGPAPRLCTRCGQAPEEPAVTRDASGGPMVVMACRQCDTESLRERSAQLESDNKHLIARIRKLEAKVAELSSRPTYDDGLMAAGVDVLRKASGPWAPANGSSRQAAMLLAQDLNRSDAEGLARVLVQLRIGVDPTMPPRGEKARRLAVIECLIAAQNEERNRG